MALKDELEALQGKLRAQMAELRKQIEAVKATAVPVYAEMELVIAEHNKLGARIQELTAQANAIEQPKLHELKMELGQVARTDDAITRQLKAMG